MILGKNIRDININKHIFQSFLFKVGSILISFMLVPLSLAFLSKEDYGIWLTISSVISWFSFFDIGLGDGLRNKFTEARALGNNNLAQKYVSTAYFSVGFIMATAILGFLFVSIFVDWSLVFNSSIKEGERFTSLIIMIVSFFCIQLVLKLITTIYIADQNHSMQGKVDFIIRFLCFILIWIFTRLNYSSLFIFSFIFSSVPVIVFIILTIYSFKRKYRIVQPRFRYFDSNLLKNLFGLGINFFIIRVSGIILFSTDNFIISNLFTPEDVIPYNLAFKYFNIANMVAAIILTPYWSSITDAYTKKDFVWIKRSMKKLVIISTIIVFVAIPLMFLVSKFAFNLWINDEVEITGSLAALMAIYFGVTILYAPFTYFINGTGKVKVQLYSLVITAVFNIPLSIYFADQLNLGSKGVILATIICLIPHLILSPIQYNKLINNKAYGVWYK
jgi:O-antigen/teichoic acid export membrane protein